MRDASCNIHTVPKKTALRLLSFWRFHVPAAQYEHRLLFCMYAFHLPVSVVLYDLYYFTLDAFALAFGELDACHVHRTLR